MHAEPKNQGGEDRREREARPAGPFSLAMFVVQLPLAPAFGVVFCGICGNWSAHCREVTTTSAWRSYVITVGTAGKPCCAIVNITRRARRVTLPRHATSKNQDDPRRLMGARHPGDRHHCPCNLATSSGRRRSWPPSASGAPPVVERTPSNDDRGHRRGPAGTLMRVTLSAAF
jgi:hypothetical protein